MDDKNKIQLFEKNPYYLGLGNETYDKIVRLKMKAQLGILGIKNINIVRGKMVCCIEKASS